MLRELEHEVFSIQVHIFYKCLISYFYKPFSMFNSFKNGTPRPMLWRKSQIINRDERWLGKNTSWSIGLHREIFKTDNFCIGTIYQTKMI